MHTEGLAFIVACFGRLAYARLPVFGSSFPKAVVSDQSPQPVRPWRVVAEELSRETDPHRVLQLGQELNQALKEQEFQISKDGRRSVE